MNAKLSLFAFAFSLSPLLAINSAEATNGNQALNTCSKRPGCISAGGGAGKNIDIVYGDKLIHCDSLKSSCTGTELHPIRASGRVAKASRLSLLRGNGRRTGAKMHL